MRLVSLLVFAVACDPGKIALDEDGVAMLFPSAPGASFRLGSQDPNASDRFSIEQNTKATAANEGALHFWTVGAHPLTYAGGGTGTTVRLHIQASGGPQQFTWKTQRGYLANPNDVRNQEFTAYVRVHVTDPNRATVVMKIRGGAHSATNGDLASCVMLDYKPTAAQFGKELIHPQYDYVQLTPRFDAGLADNRWVGLKMVSYAPPGDSTRVVNRLYLDIDPFDGNGKPRNAWRLFSEYTDVAGVSTGQYATLVDWGGWLTTVRSDGISRLDFLLVGVREIAPR